MLNQKNKVALRPGKREMPIDPGFGRTEWPGDIFQQLWCSSLREAPPKVVQIIQTLPSGVFAA